MSTYILAEHDNSHLHPSTAHTLTAALRLDNAPVVVVAGFQCEAVAKQAAQLASVAKVLWVDNPCFAHPLAENLSTLLRSLIKEGDTLLAPANTFGKNTLPRVAASLDVTQVSDVTKIIDNNTFEHPIYAGNAIETVRILDSIRVLTIRTTAFDAASTSQEPCSLESLHPDLPLSKTSFVKQELSVSTRPSLDSAQYVVSGGRGLQSAEKFALIEALADALGAAVGASRAAVDAGFVSNDYQVGQTGKVVAPSLYIAVGISGAVQHLAGMKDSKVIVAINKDADAPIFQIANYGLVGDLFELVPQLIEQITTVKRG